MESKDKENMPDQYAPPKTEQIDVSGQGFSYQSLVNGGTEYQAIAQNTPDQGHSTTPEANQHTTNVEAAQDYQNSYTSYYGYPNTYQNYYDSTNQPYSGMYYNQHAPADHFVQLPTPPIVPVQSPELINQPSTQTLHDQVSQVPPSPYVPPSTPQTPYNETYVVKATEQPVEQRKKGFSKKVLFLIVLVGVLIIVAIALTVVLVTRNSKNSNQESGSTTSGSNTLTATSTSSAPSATTTFTSTKLDSAFPLRSPNNQTIALFDSSICKFSLEVSNREVWRTPTNPYYTCEMHLVNNGNLYMYQPSSKTIVWRALSGGGRDLSHRYDFYVSNNGTAFLYDLTSEVAYWTIP